METYGAWGKEALEAFSMLASRLATSSSRPKSMVLSELHGRLNLHLVRAHVRAIFLQTFMPSSGIHLSLFVIGVSEIMHYKKNKTRTCAIIMHY